MSERQIPWWVIRKAVSRALGERVVGIEKRDGDWFVLTEEGDDE